MKKGVRYHAINGGLARQWSMSDIIVAAVVAVATGLLFRVFDGIYPIFKALSTATYPPLIGLYSGVWMLAGVLGAAIVRKPGAALFCELVAASLSASLGSAWGLETLFWGLMQGFGAEAIFFILRYRRYGLLATGMAGGASAVASGLFEVSLGSKIAWNAVAKCVYVGCLGLSGVLLVGGLSWWLVRRLRETGVLRPMNSGKAAPGGESPPPGRKPIATTSAAFREEQSDAG